jgi:DNA-binding NarL/FixJ family response regulator
MGFGDPPAGRAHFIVGRDAELARIDAFVSECGSAPRALLFRGEPGIGKTTLWRQAVERGRGAGATVMVARPAEEEMPLPLIGLVDLFERSGVNVDRIRAEPDAFARGRLVLEALRGLEARAPTIVAVDDLQWLDSGSTHALRYALRRLDRARIGVVATLHPDREDPLDLSRCFPLERVEVLELSGLSLSDLRLALAGTLASISLPELRRVHRASAGNPFYAIELARELQRGDGADRPVAALPLPESLRAAIDLRLETVPPEVTKLLRLVAAVGPTTIRELRRTSDEPLTDEVLAEAEGLGLLAVDEELGVGFAHPLIASAVYAGTTPVVRQALHARLSEIAVDDDVRARHLALSTMVADPRVADLLETAAERAGDRGAHDLAAEFAAHSLRLTPAQDGEGRYRRALSQIEQLAAAGDVQRALGLADALVEATPPGARRAGALILRFDLEDDECATGVALLERALADAGDDDRLRCRILDDLGNLHVMSAGGVSGAIASARAATEVATRVGDPGLEIRTAARLAHWEVLSGLPRTERMRDLIDRAARAGTTQLGAAASAAALLAKQLLWAGELAEARPLFESALAEAVEAGNELRRPFCLYDLAVMECAAGEFLRAESLVREGIRAARDAGNPYAERLLLYPAGLGAAWLARDDEARTTAERLLTWASGRGERPGVVQARRVLGLVALSLGDSVTAAEELGRAAGALEEMGVAHPGAFPVLPDEVEARAGAGDLAAASESLDRIERQAEAADSPWARAAASRARGVVLLAGGEADEAADVLGSAAARLDVLGFRPDAARAIFSRGRALLRGGHRTLAADALAEARDRFAGLGAGLWEARAVEALERASPGRAAGELTPAEMRVADLIAKGMKNREIASELFMGVATVEAHLTRIYRKLDIRSRSELARLVAEGSLARTDG